MAQYMWAQVTDLPAPYDTHPRADYWLRVASHTLFILTGEKYQGVRTITEFFNQSGSNFGYAPIVVEGAMYNLPIKDVTSGISFNAPLARAQSRLQLRFGPVRRITTVIENGRILDPTEYSVRDRTILRKTSGLPWMFSDQNELAVTYSYGAEPPLAGKDAAVMLAYQLLLQEEDSNDCILPKSVTSIDRQGTTIEVANPQKFIDEGKTGIYSVDLFIKTYNPTRALKKAKVIRPGSIRGEI